MKSTLLGALAAAAARLGGAAHAAANLPQLNIDKTQTTVSGRSSGGFMAAQLHVAYLTPLKTGVSITVGRLVSIAR